MKKELSLIFLIFIIVSSLVLFIQGKIIHDSDNDGVPDEKDLCPNSLLGESVDKDGCDQFQFCSQFYCSPFCFDADWKADENNTNPLDCTIVIVEREGYLYPRCIPLDCGKTQTLEIPNEIITMSVVYIGTPSYWITNLSNVPSGFGAINNTEYNGWCVDEFIQIANPNIPYNARLYSSYDPNLAIKCPYCYDPDWDKVNYIINHKQGNGYDIQKAVWFFIDGGAWPAEANAQAMILDALANGNGFVPSKGELIAVIVDVGIRNQVTFIEVDP